MAEQKASNSGLKRALLHALQEGCGVHDHCNVLELFVRRLQAATEEERDRKEQRGSEVEARYDPHAVSA